MKYKNTQIEIELQIRMYNAQSRMASSSTFSHNLSDMIVNDEECDDELVVGNDASNSTDGNCSHDEEDLASVDHLSEGEDEIYGVRKKVANDWGIMHQGTLMGSYELDENDFVLEEDFMRDEHERNVADISGAAVNVQAEDVIKQSDDEEDNVTYPRFNPYTHWRLTKPIMGERYESPGQLKECITNYALANGYQLWYERNDHKKLLVRCGKNIPDDQPKCPYRLWATWMGRERSFQVKSLVDEHRCYRNFNFGPLMNYKFIARRFAHKLRKNPEMKLVDLQAAVLKKFKCKVSTNQVYRAKVYARHEFELSMNKHYDKLWDYAEEIRRTNPGSTVKVKVEVSPDGRNYFEGFYVCLKGLKDGWNSGCRKIIGLDGCFLKTICKGELLSAVGRDGNNHIYPVAWAVVNVENKANWSWFIELLRDDLSLNIGHGITLISDQHKILVCQMEWTHLL